MPHYETFDFRAKNYLERLAAIHARYTRRSEATVAFKAMGSGDMLKRLRSGATVTTKRVDRALEWFSVHWHPDAPWPDDIPRPPHPSTVKARRNA